MRLLLALAFACAPRGYYVANVYRYDGALVQEKCELGFAGKPNPRYCHLEPIEPLRNQYPIPQNLFDGLPPPRIIPDR